MANVCILFSWDHHFLWTNAHHYLSEILVERLHPIWRDPYVAPINSLLSPFLNSITDRIFDWTNCKIVNGGRVSTNIAEKYFKREESFLWKRVSLMANKRVLMDIFSGHWKIWRVHRFNNQFEFQLSLVPMRV